MGEKDVSIYQNYEINKTYIKPSYIDSIAGQRYHETEEDAHTRSGAQHSVVVAAMTSGRQRTLHWVYGHRDEYRGIQVDIEFRGKDGLR